ncbi:hypothetical protein ACOSOMT5_P1725 [Acidiphilium sp. MT5]
MPLVSKILWISFLFVMRFYILLGLLLMLYQTRFLFGGVDGTALTCREYSILGG